MAAALLCAPSVMAEETVFSYAPAEGTKAAIGSGTKAWNDLAILIKDPGYVGYEVLSVSIDVPVVDGCTCDPNAKAWLAHDLTVDQTTCMFVPDISVDGVITNYGTEENPEYRLDVTFPEPYVLTEDGIYVGYSIKTTALMNSTQKYPLQIISSTNPQGGLFVHFARVEGSTIPPLPKNTSFLDLSMTNMAVSTMRVFLKGSKASNDAAISAPANLYGLTSGVTSVNATVYNYGSEDITELTYGYTSKGDAEAEFSGILTLPSPLAAGESMVIPFPFEMPATRGNFEYDLTISAVNGEENLNTSRTVSFTAYSRPWIPRKRVLIEEYTGFWCGYCPEAYVAINQIRDKRPDDVVVIAFHRGDKLQTITSDKMPDPNSGEPAIRLDRNRVPVTFQNCDNEVAECLDTFAPANLDLDLYWNDETRTTLRAVANLRFVDPAEADQYRLAYALVEDDMSDPTWGQRNFFYDKTKDDSDWYNTDYWDLFLAKDGKNGSYDVNGIVYDDVALSFPNCLGIPESVPALEVDQKYQHHALFDPAAAVGSYNTNQGQIISRNRDKLRVAAVLVDTRTGDAVNAATSCYAVDLPVYDESTVGVETLPADNGTAVVAEEYYSASGLRLAERPAKGVVIVVRHHEDGSVTTAKIVQ